MTQSAPPLLRPVCVLAALMATTPLLAQDADPETELQRYRVEVILFENTVSGATPEDPGLPELPPALTLEPYADETPEADTEHLAPAKPPAPEAGSLFYEPAEGFALSDVADRLRRRSGYRVLVHEAWRQPGFDRAGAQPVELERLARIRARGTASATSRPAPGTAPAGLEDPPLSASATFYRSRYLHLILAASLGDDGARQIRERRRMRIGELHYFDAPGLGAVATVTRVETPDPEDEIP